MADIKDDAKLNMSMVPNPNTGEVEVLITIEGADTDHGWFFMRKDLVALLAQGKAEVPQAEKQSPIEIAKVMPGSEVKQ